MSRSTVVGVALPTKNAYVMSMAPTLLRLGFAMGLNGGVAGMDLPPHVFRI